MWCEIDRLHVCLDIFYCSLSKVYYWVHRPVDLLISCHVIIMHSVKYVYLKIKLQIYSNMCTYECKNLLQIDSTN